MLSKAGLAITCALFIFLGLIAIFFILSHNRVKKVAVPDERPPAITQHGPKPSPGVPRNESKAPAGPAVSAAPNAAPAPPAPWPPDGMQFTAHHKGHNGCEGMVTLKASGLQFTCPGDDSKSFSVALTDIRGPDDDGIATTSGAKYHFDKVPGGGKEYVEGLFADWLSRAHAVQAPPQ